MLLAGCTETNSPSDRTEQAPLSTSIKEQETSAFSLEHRKPVQFSVGEQQFEIIPQFHLVMNYLDQMEKNGNKDHEALYHATVVEPFGQRLFGPQGVESLKNKASFAAPKRLEALEESVRVLDEEYDAFISLIQEALQESANRLPGKKEPIKIYLFPFNPDHYDLVSKMNGVIAFTKTNNIVMHIAPQQFDESNLQYTLAHEYHHAFYFQNYDYDRTDLLEYVLSEGKADAFAKTIYKEASTPWTKPLSHEQEEAIWERIKEIRYSFDAADLSELRLGTNNLPPWSEYRMGGAIMTEYLKENPDSPIEEWTLMKADEVLEKSGYDER